MEDDASVLVFAHMSLKPEGGSEDLAAVLQRLATEFMQLPRYLKVSTLFSAFLSMAILGVGGAVFC